MDPRIGVLNSGKFYAYVNGYDAEPVIGSLEEVEVALGLRPAVSSSGRKEDDYKLFNVVVKFEHPAWDEVNGIEYPNISARSKHDANRIVRAQAYADGHTVGRRAWLTATEV